MSLVTELQPLDPELRASPSPAPVFPELSLHQSSGVYFSFSVGVQSHLLAWCQFPLRPQWTSSVQSSSPFPSLSFLRALHAPWYYAGARPSPQVAQRFPRGQRVQVSALSPFVLPLSPLPCPCVCSLRQRFIPCPADRVTRIRFLDPTYMDSYTVFALLFLDSLTLYDRP